jgi:transketolase
MSFSTLALLECLTMSDIAAIADPTADPAPDHMLAVNTLRTLAFDAVAAAKEGHPGGPAGMALMAYTLFARVMRYNPQNPHWAGRDRFVLSAGHASMALYGALHLAGYDLSLEQIKAFRQWGSQTAGHPEYGHAPGVETTTGPLGQGFANAVGMALAQSHLAARFNTSEHPIISYSIYGICSDGDLQEGISHEAASLAGHLGLGNLVMLYDDNSIQLDGPTAWAFSEDISQRFAAYGWHVETVSNGDSDLEGLEAAIRVAQADPRPSLIRVKTTIGYGLPKAGTAEVHGKAPSLDDVLAAKAKLGYPSMIPFELAEAGVAPWRAAGAHGVVLEQQWQALWADYSSSHPEKAAELQGILSGEFPAGWDSDLPVYQEGSKAVATRTASHNCINAIAPKLPALIGGSADLASSNKTDIASSSAIAPGQFAGRNIRFGVREHAMAAIANGLALSGLRPFVATFLIFSDYCKNSIRLAALMGLPVIYVFTHDSIAVGTDGPTHQPVEQLAGLRAIPNIRVFRPADANETAIAWKLALERKDGPTVLALSRQDLPVLAANNSGSSHGGYVLAESDGAKVTLIATGSEVSLALAAQQQLASEGVAARVVSLPSWELFAAQSKDYQASVLGHAPKLAIEAASSFGWARWSDDSVTLERFGASAPEKTVMENLGFSVANVVSKAKALIAN